MTSNVTLNEMLKTVSVIKESLKLKLKKKYSKIWIA